MSPLMTRRQTTAALGSPVLPWLLVLALGAGPVVGPGLRGALDPVPSARAQSRIDELKGKPGQGVRSDDVPAGRTG